MNLKTISCRRIYRRFKAKTVGLPSKITVESSTICNLKCPSCPTGQEAPGLSKGFLKFSDFKKLADEIYTFTEGITFSNYGEIFLNPEIFQIINYATSKNMLTWSDTNLNHFTLKMAEQLVQVQMTLLNISIDGATPETYKKYRLNGDFNQVLKNIEMINQAKKKYHSPFPLLKWQFIIFDYNEHEILKAKKMAKQNRMAFSLKYNWDQSFHQSKNPRYNVINYQKKYKKRYRDECLSLLNSPVINWNGNMLGCCFLYDEKQHFGNVFENGFKKIYQGERFKKALYYHQKKIQEIATDIPCATCPILAEKKKHNEY